MSTTTAHTIADSFNPSPRHLRDVSCLVSAWDRDHLLREATAAATTAEGGPAS